VFRWEEPEQAYLLLYPEGIIKLNDSAGSILTHCTGEKTLEKIIADLEEAFEMSDLQEDVFSFIEVALGKGWIRVKD
jgi:pyrroloquinoline quinone biosynthesis protein D